MEEFAPPRKEWTNFEEKVTPFTVVSVYETLLTASSTVLTGIQGVVLCQCKSIQAVPAVGLSLAVHCACTGVMAKAVMDMKELR